MKIRYRVLRYEVCSRYRNTFAFLIQGNAKSQGAGAGVERAAKSGNYGGWGRISVPRCSRFPVVSFDLCISTLSCCYIFSVVSSDTCLLFVRA